jgi:pimeloyl-ACP methyl ester carboxylesterase
VTERLAAAGVSVMAIVNPLRGIAVDAAYVAGVIRQTPGRVLAVGHSYGGAIITNAVPQTANVAGLVYVAAFAPDEGELLIDRVTASKDSRLTTALKEYQYPAGPEGETATEVIIDPLKFRGVFTADLPQLQSDVCALSQRPIAAAAFSGKNGPAAWKGLPAWAAVGSRPRRLAAMARRRQGCSGARAGGGP